MIPKTTIVLLLILLIWGCKNEPQSKKETISQQYIQREDKNPIYDLIIQKKETGENLANEFSYDSLIGLTEDEKSNLKKTGLENGYYLTNINFLKKTIDSIEFQVYYKISYGSELEKVVRIKRKDTIFDLSLALTGGDGGESWQEDTEFLNDSVFERRFVSKSMVVDDTYLVANSIDSIVKRYSYTNKLDLVEVRIDSFKTANTGFIDYPFEKITSNHELSKRDSLELLLFWRKTLSLNLDIINANLSNTVLDSLYSIRNQHIANASVMVSPDNLFKILTLHGMSYGAYDSPYWKSELLLSNGLTVKGIGFFDVEKIYIMPDGKYLILEESSSRPIQAYGVVTKTASLVSIQEKKIILHPFESHLDKNLKDGRLSISQMDFIRAKLFIEYDSIANEINYGYGTERGNDSVIYYNGKFKFQNGEFIQLNEQKEIKKRE